MLFFLVGFPFLYSWCLIPMHGVSRRTGVVQESPILPRVCQSRGFEWGDEGIKMCCSSGKCFHHFCTFRHLHAEQIFILHFHTPEYLFCLFVHLPSVLPVYYHIYTMGKWWCLCVWQAGAGSGRVVVQWVCRVQFLIVWNLSWLIEWHAWN